MTTTDRGLLDSPALVEPLGLSAVIVDFLDRHRA